MGTFDAARFRSGLVSAIANAPKATPGQVLEAIYAFILRAIKYFPLSENVDEIATIIEELFDQYVVPIDFPPPAFIEVPLENFVRGQIRPLLEWLVDQIPEG